MEDNQKIEIQRYSEIEFRFAQPLNPEQREIFVGYFDDMVYSVMDRLNRVIHGTDRNPVKAMMQKHLAPIVPQLMMKYEAIYGKLQRQMIERTDKDIFVLEDNLKESGIWTFRMDMKEFDLISIEELQAHIPNKDLQNMVRQYFSMLDGKDKRIKLDFQRKKLAEMKLRNDQCTITSKIYGEAEIKAV